MTTTNFNRKLVQTLQETFIRNIKSRMTDRGLNKIDFKTQFYIYIVDSNHYNEDNIRVPWVAQSLFQDGSMLVQAETEEGSIQIESLDIYELAMIMDILESSDYTVVDDDDDQEFIDPAGGRGLQSHI